MFKKVKIALANCTINNSYTEKNFVIIREGCNKNGYYECQPFFKSAFYGDFLLVHANQIEKMFYSKKELDLFFEKRREELNKKIPNWHLNCQDISFLRMNGIYNLKDTNL